MPFEASDERYSYSVGALCSRLIDEHLARFSISFHDSTRVISVVSANLIDQSINPSLNQAINQAIARYAYGVLAVAILRVAKVLYEALEELAEQCLFVLFARKRRQRHRRHQGASSARKVPAATQHVDSAPIARAASTLPTLARG